jgi:hypothetical protein
MSPYEVSTSVVEWSKRVNTEQGGWGNLDLLFDFWGSAGLGKRQESCLPRIEESLSCSTSAAAPSQLDVW